MGLEDINPNVLLVAGLALAAFVLLRKSRGLFSAVVKTEPPPSPRRELFAAKSRDSALTDAPVEVLRWQVEMHQTARDLKAEIDTKLVALQAITRLAHEERQRLEATIEHARRMGIESRDVLDTIENLASDPAAAADLPSLATARQLPLDHPLAARARELSVAGHSAASIAEQMTIPIGDVELTLSLERHNP